MKKKLPIIIIGAILLFVVFIQLFYWPLIVNAPKRMHIRFKDPVIAVADSMKVMVALIDSLPIKPIERANGFIYWFHYGDMWWKVYGEQIDGVKDKNYAFHSIYSKSGSVTYNHFIKLVAYLKNNYISELMLDGEGKRFTYQEIYYGDRRFEHEKVPLL